MNKIPVECVKNKPSNIIELTCFYCKGIVNNCIVDSDSIVSCKECFINNANSDGIRGYPSYSSFKLYDKLVNELNLFCNKDKCNWEGKGKKRFLNHKCVLPKEVKPTKKRPSSQLFFGKSDSFQTVGNEIKFFESIEYKLVLSHYTVKNAPLSWIVKAKSSSEVPWFCTGLADRDVVEAIGYNFVRNSVLFHQNGLYGVSNKGAVFNCTLEEENKKDSLEKVTEIKVVFDPSNNRIGFKIGETVEKISRLEGKSLCPFLLTNGRNTVIQAKKK